ncbi:ATP synthase protein I [Salsuginibacillus halophilus]|uniref:ATP synthase protein I n=1 Tax=Salsuginibacillus halophilus TaxID=517424 RepID=A0A2P8HHS7_9BACI|nr:ATP synthase subunit I [Salsuginibacillus halophilus]PSL45782.1 ATP synthase protein I [Salsuginibacillus halophilus]
MTDYGVEIRRIAQWTMYAMALYALGWGFTPYTPVFAGLLLGGAFSLYNVWSMYQKIRKLGEAAASGGRFMTLGTLSRLAVGALAAVVIIQFPDEFHPAGVVGGLMTPYVLIFFRSLLEVRRL